MIGGKSALAALVLIELRMLVRDWRFLVFSLLMPVLVMPVFFYISIFSQRGLEKRQAEATFRYAILGPEGELVRELAEAGAEKLRADAEEKAAEEEEGEEEDGSESPAAGVMILHLEEVDSADPAADFAAEEIHFYVETLSAAVLEEPADSPVAAAAALPLVRLVYRSNWDFSSTAARTMKRRLEAGQEVRRRALLEEHGFPVTEDQVAVLESADVATAEQRTGATFGRFATLLLMFLLLTGGSVVAADSIAGEKERGTLETLLTTAIRRGEVVIAKQLVILTVGLVIALIQIANLAVYVGLGVIDVPESFAVDLSPLTLGLLLLLFLPMAALVASALLLASGQAKTYKEFQVYFLPIFLGMLAPAAAALLPGVSLRSGIVLVPLANLSVAVREVLTGEIDVPMLVLAWVVSMAAAALGARWTFAMLSTERLITASDIGRGEHQGGPALFPRRVLYWFAFMWVAIFLTAATIPLFRNIHVQLLFNLIMVMLGGSLLMIRVYRLDLREALALRPVKPAIWLAVVLGAPSMFLSGIALAKLSGALFPMPERMLEEFARTLLPPDLPLWELLLLIAVLPAICEEITFRGVLLHGLRKRFSPPVLCLVVGVIFGLFHIQLNRLLPTAFLGVVFAVVTLLTGSIYPAMLWHALNNATAVLAEEAGFDLLTLDSWAYGAGTVVAALSFVLVWRHRTPYPDLRTGWALKA